jgi:hypothetical protein
LYHKDDYEITSYEWPIELTNTEDGPIRVELSIKTPEYTYNGTTSGMPKTTVLPDLTWVSIEKTEFRLEVNQTAQTKIHINMTNSTEAYNQSYEFWIFANQVEGPGNIRTNYNTRWVLITPTRWVPFDQRAGYIPPWIIPLAIIVVVGIVAGLVLIWKLPRRRHAVANGNGASKVETVQKHKQRKQEKPKEVINEKPKEKPIANNNPVNQPNVIRYKKPQR